MTIKKADGSAYPAGGETVTVGTDLDVHVFGKTESSALNDVVITAKTDKTGDCECGREDLTVLFCTLSFNAQQGAAPDANNSQRNQIINDAGGALGLQDVSLNTAQADLFNNMELTVTVMPGDKKIPGAAWDIKREKERREWENGLTAGFLQVLAYSTAGVASDDDSVNTDEDLAQNEPNDLKLFSIDCVCPRPMLGNKIAVRTKTLNFREWVEVRIAGKWFVASNYVYWKSLFKAQSTQQNPPNWSRVGHDTATSVPKVPNEIKEGNYSEAPNTWTQD